MNSEEYKFKTNINCSNCLKQVKPFLDQLEGLQSWHVDLLDENKLLHVSTNQLKVEEIKDVVEEAGFSIEKLK